MNSTLHLRTDIVARPCAPAHQSAQPIAVPTMCGNAHVSPSNGWTNGTGATFLGFATYATKRPTTRPLAEALT